MQLHFFFLKLYIYLFLFHRGIEGISGTLLSSDVTRTSGVERVVHHGVPGVLGEVGGDVEVALLLVPGSHFKMNPIKRTQ